METGSIKSNSAIRPQNLGARPQVRRVATASGDAGSFSDSQGLETNRRVPETQNLVSANGRVYDRSTPHGTYLNLLV